MKIFLFSFIKIIIGIYISALFLDNIFDYIFTKYSKRNAFNILENKTYDLVVIGDSRAQGNIIPEIIDSALNISSINVASPALYPVDILAGIELYISKNKTPKFILIELGETYKFKSASKLGRQQFLPYYKSNILSNYYNYCEDSKYYNIPLYRYIKYRDIGWRELYKILINNHNNIFELGKGYRKVEVIGTDILNTNINWGKAQRMNIHIQSIIDLCKSNNIFLIFFTSPVYGEFDQNLCNYFDAKINNYINQSKLIANINYFADRTHVNHKGAIIQTLHLIEGMKKLTSDKLPK